MLDFDIKDNKTTPKYSQCNGKAESQNRRINIAMRVSLSDDQYENYDIYIKYIVFCLNSLVCSRTKYSANFIAFGRELRMPRDLFVKDDDRLDGTLCNMSKTDYTKLHAYNLYKRVSEVTRKVRDNAEKRAMYVCKQYDKHVRGPYFKEGDLCFVLVIVPKHKYADKWAGPYRITEKISDYLYIVDVKGGKKVVNVSKMKVYKPNRYSQLGEKSVIEKISTDNKNVRHKTTKKSKKSQELSDSSDDGDVIISIYDPIVRKRVGIRKNPVRRARGSKISDPHNPSSAVEKSPATDVTDDSDYTLGSRGDQAVDQGDENVSLPADLATQEAHPPSQLDTSGTSDQEFVDANEALDDVNTSMEQGASVRSRDFQTIDNADIALADIQRHETEIGLTNPSSNITGGQLNRSTTLQDLPRSSAKYSLRPRPASVQKYGMPAVSVLKRKFTKRK